jgi:predicted membrane channel-forming protein YqfA (hemolysin III family)
MVKRIAKEWLWLLGAAIAALGLSLVFRGAFWKVGETGVVLASMYGLSAVVRTTIWAVRTAHRPATT